MSIPRRTVFPISSKLSIKRFSKGAASLRNSATYPWATHYRQSRHNCTMTTGHTLTRESGTRYAVEQVLREKDELQVESILHGLCLSLPSMQHMAYKLPCSAADESFIVKTVQPYDFKFFKDMYDSMPRSPYLRCLQDSVQADSDLVYKFLTVHLLSFAQKTQPVSNIKKILRDVLQGLAMLHANGKVHTCMLSRILVDVSC